MCIIVCVRAIHAQLREFLYSTHNKELQESKKRYSAPPYRGAHLNSADVDAWASSFGKSSPVITERLSGESVNYK